jgi:hypothetical protein
MYSDAAPAKLKDLEKLEDELAKSSAVFPNKPELMSKWQDYVLMHHQDLVAA